MNNIKYSWCTRIIVLLTFITLLFSGNELIAQTIAKLRSTVSKGGSSSSFTSNGQEYMVQQSIGQPGVISSYKANGLVLRQGFIQPIYLKTKTDLSKSLQANTFPNPFSSFFTISFNDVINENLQVTVIDLYGKYVYKTKFPSSQALKISLVNLQPGLYTLKVNTGNKYFTSKIIKL